MKKRTLEAGDIILISEKHYYVTEMPDVENSFRLKIKSLDGEEEYYYAPHEMPHLSKRITGTIKVLR